MSKWQTKIIGSENVDPRQLTGNPLNHRTHPQAQRDVVRDSIKNLGFVKSILVNKRTGYIVDGHERAQTALNEIEELERRGKDASHVLVSVEYIDVSESEEAAILAVLDASTEMAVVDPVKLDELLREFNTGSEAIQEMLSDLAEASGSFDVEDAALPELGSEDVDLEQMTFTLSRDQSAKVKQAIELAIGQGVEEDPVNKNKNGNALFYIAEVFCGN